MYSLFIIFFDILLLLTYVLIGFIIFMIIQLISYRIFKFNLYKFLNYILIEKEMKNNEKYNIRK